MKLNFLNLPETRRRRAIEEAATRRMTLSVIVEKDFWVCWMLGVVFESPFAKASTTGDTAVCVQAHPTDFRKLAFAVPLAKIMLCPRVSVRNSKGSYGSD